MGDGQDQIRPPLARRLLRGTGRWSLRVGVALVALVLLVVGAALIVLHTDWGRARVLGLTLELVGGLFEGQIVAARMEGSPFGTLVLVDVEVLTPDGTVAIAASRVEVEADLLDLLDSHVRLLHVGVQDLRGTVLGPEGQVLAAEAFALTDVSPPSPEPSPWVVDLEQIAVSVRRVDKGGPEPAITLLDGSVMGSLHVGGSDLVWDDVVVMGKLLGLPVDTVELETEGALVRGDLSVPRLRLVAGPHRLEASGGLLGDGGRYWLDVREADVDLDAIAPGVGLVGRATVQAGVAGIGADVRARAVVHTDGGDLAVHGWLDATGETAVYAAEVVALGLDPTRVWTEMPLPLTGDVLIAARGEGNPLEGGRATVAVNGKDLGGHAALPRQLDVMARTTEAGLVVSLQADGPNDAWLNVEGTAADPLAGPWVASIAGGGFDLAVLSEALGLESVTGRVRSLEGMGRVGYEDGRLDGRVSLDLTAGQLGTEIDGAPVRAERVTVSAHGRLGGALWVEDGAAVIALDGVETPWVGLGSARVDLTARTEDGELRLVGPVEVTRLVVPGSVTVETARAGLDVGMKPDGSLAGRVNLTTGRLVADAVRLASATAALDVSVELGDPLAVRAGGTVGARGFAVGADLAVQVVTAKVALRLMDGFPVGTADVTLDGVRLIDQTLEQLTAGLVIDAKRNVTITADGQGERVGATVSAHVALPDGGSRVVGARIDALSIRAGERSLSVSPGAEVSLSRGGAIEAKGLVVRGVGMAGEIRLDGSYRPRQRAVSALLEVNSIALGAWTEVLSAWVPGIDKDLGMSGFLDATVRVSGTPRAPAVDGEVRIKGGRFGPIRGLDGSITLALGAEGIVAKGEGKWRPDGEFRVDATVPASLSLDPFAFEVAQDERLRVDLLVSPLKLVWLRELVREDLRRTLAGEIVVAASISGTAAEPVGQLFLRTDDAAFGKLGPARIVGGFVITPDRAQAQLQISEEGQERLAFSLEIPTPSLRAVTSGASAEEILATLESEPIGLRVRSPGFDLGRLPLTDALGEAIGGASLTADLVGGGAIRDLVLEGHLDVRRVMVGDSLFHLRTTMETVDGGTGILAELSSGRRVLADVNVRLPREMGTLAISEGLGSLLEQPDLHVRAQMAPLDAETLMPLSPGAAQALEALLPGASGSATIDVRGNPAGPVVLVAADLESISRPSDLTNVFARDIAVWARLDGTEFRWHAAIGQGGQGGYLSLVGSADVGTTDLLAGDVAFGALPITAKLVSKEFSLEQMARTAPGILGKSTGTFDLDISVSGTPQSPVVQGEGKAHFEVFDLVALGLRLDEPFDVVLTVDDSGVRILPLETSAMGGTLKLEAAVDFDGPSLEEMPLFGGIALDRFPIVSTSTARLKLSGDVAFTGTLDRPSVTGELTVIDGYFSPDMGSRSVRPIGTPEDVIFVRAGARQDRRGAARGRSRHLPDLPVELSVVVIIPDRGFVVKNDMLDIVLSGRVAADTETGSLALSGLVEVQEGKVEMYGKKFTIDERSRVVFDGSNEIDPALNVSARYDIADIDLSPLGVSGGDGSYVLLEVTGTATQPLLTLSSQPPMDDTNIVSIVVMGTPVGAGEGTGDSMKAQTMNLFAGLATGTVARFVQGELPIDVFQFSSTSEDFSEARVRVGKRFTKDLLVLYEAHIGAAENENANEVKVQYRILDNLELETRFGDAGEGAVNLLFRWSY
jgi:autotransporter translocation and assembly factor TamB